MAHSDSLCNKCGRCIEVCEEKAISVGDEGVRIDRKRCTNCGNCVEVCSIEALKIYGKYMSVQEVFQEVQRDAQYYENSGGGVTASGGEPLSQADFTTALFKLCREAGIHTCLDTCGYANSAALEQVLKYTSLVLFDVKHADPIVHRELTGWSNDKIIANLNLTVAQGTPLIIRVPLIPGFNDSDEEVTAIGRTIAGIKEGIKVDVLPYHRLGIGKYKMLDRRYRLGELTRPTDAKLRRVKAIFESFRTDCEIAE